MSSDIISRIMRLIVAAVFTVTTIGQDYVWAKDLNKAAIQRPLLSSGLEEARQNAGLFGRAYGVLEQEKRGSVASQDRLPPETDPFTEWHMGQAPRRFLAVSLLKRTGGNIDLVDYSIQSINHMLRDRAHLTGVSIRISDHISRFVPGPGDILYKLEKSEIAYLSRLETIFDLDGYTDAELSKIKYFGPVTVRQLRLMVREVKKEIFAKIIELDEELRSLQEKLLKGAEPGDADEKQVERVPLPEPVAGKEGGEVRPDGKVKSEPRSLTSFSETSSWEDIVGYVKANGMTTIFVDIGEALFRVGGYVASEKWLWRKTHSQGALRTYQESDEYHEIIDEAMFFFMSEAGGALASLVKNKKADELKGVKIIGVDSGNKAARERNRQAMKYLGIKLDDVIYPQDKTRIDSINGYLERTRHPKRREVLYVSSWRGFEAQFNAASFAFNVKGMHYYDPKDDRGDIAKTLNRGDTYLEDAIRKEGNREKDNGEKLYLYAAVEYISALELSHELSMEERVALYKKIPSVIERLGDSIANTGLAVGFLKRAFSVHTVDLLYKVQRERKEKTEDILFLAQKYFQITTPDNWRTFLELYKEGAITFKRASKSQVFKGQDFIMEINRENIYAFLEPILIYIYRYRPDTVVVADTGARPFLWAIKMFIEEFHLTTKVALLPASAKNVADSRYEMMRWLTLGERLHDGVPVRDEDLEVARRFKVFFDEGLLRGKHVLFVDDNVVSGMTVNIAIDVLSRFGIKGFVAGTPTWFNDGWGSEGFSRVHCHIESTFDMPSTSGNYGWKIGDSVRRPPIVAATDWENRPHVLGIEKRMRYAGPIITVKDPERAEAFKDEMLSCFRAHMDKFRANIETKSREDTPPSFSSDSINVIKEREDARLKGFDLRGVHDDVMEATMGRKAKRLGEYERFFMEVKTKDGGLKRLWLADSFLVEDVIREYVRFFVETFEGDFDHYLHPDFINFAISKKNRGEGEYGLVQLLDAKSGNKKVLVIHRIMPDYDLDIDIEDFLDKLFEKLEKLAQGLGYDYILVPRYIDLVSDRQDIRRSLEGRFSFSPYRGLEVSLADTKKKNLEAFESTRYGQYNIAYKRLTADDKQNFESQAQRLKNILELTLDEFERGIVGRTIRLVAMGEKLTARQERFLERIRKRSVLFKGEYEELLPWQKWFLERTGNRDKSPSDWNDEAMLGYTALEFYHLIKETNDRIAEIDEDEEEGYSDFPSLFFGWGKGLIRAAFLARYLVEGILKISDLSLLRESDFSDNGLRRVFEEAFHSNLFEVAEALYPGQYAENDEGTLITRQLTLQELNVWFKTGGNLAIDRSITVSSKDLLADIELDGEIPDRVVICTRADPNHGLVVVVLTKEDYERRNYQNALAAYIRLEGSKEAVKVNLAAENIIDTAMGKKDILPSGGFVKTKVGRRGRGVGVVIKGLDERKAAILIPKEAVNKFNLIDKKVKIMAIRDADFGNVIQVTIEGELIATYMYVEEQGGLIEVDLNKRAFYFYVLDMPNMHGAKVYPRGAFYMEPVADGRSGFTLATGESLYLSTGGIEHLEDIKPIIVARGNLQTGWTIDFHDAQLYEKDKRREPDITFVKDPDAPGLISLEEYRSKRFTPEEKQRFDGLIDDLKLDTVRDLFKGRVDPVIYDLIVSYSPEFCNLEELPDYMDDWLRRINPEARKEVRKERRKGKKDKQSEDKQSKRRKKTAKRSPALKELPLKGFNMSSLNDGQRALVIGPIHELIIKVLYPYFEIDRDSVFRKLKEAIIDEGIDPHLREAYKYVFDYYSNVFNLMISGIADSDKLKLYQLMGIKRMLEQSEMVLADETRIGKTVQALSVVLNMRDLEREKPPFSLIVAPSSAAGVWHEQVRKWVRDKHRVFIMDPSSGTGRVYYGKDDKAGTPKTLDEYVREINAHNDTVSRENYVFPFVIVSYTALRGHFTELYRFIGAKFPDYVKRVNLKEFVSRFRLYDATAEEICNAIISELGESRVHGGIKSELRSKVKAAIGTFDAVKRFKKDIIILDEAHRLRNESSLQSQALQYINGANGESYSSGAKKILISATPLVGREPVKIYPLLSWLNPVIELDGGVKRFKELFPDIGSFISVFANTTEGRLRLYRFLRSHMIRRKKEDVLKHILPPVKTEIYKVPLADEELGSYRRIDKEFLVWLREESEREGRFPKEVHIFSQLLRLMQFSAGLRPSVGKIIFDKNSSKAVALDRIIEEKLSRGEKVVVFSRFKEVTQSLMKRYEAKGIGVCGIDGDMDSQKRDGEIERFQTDPDKKIFISTYGTGSESIDLNAANNVVLYDFEWVPPIQAVNRVHSFGQDKEVNIIYLAAEGYRDDRGEYVESIDERIIKLQRFKQKVFDQSIDGIIVTKGEEKKQMDIVISARMREELKNIEGISRDSAGEDKDAQTDEIKEKIKEELKARTQQGRPIKVVVSDIDGILTQNDSYIRPDMAELVRHISENLDMRLVVASGQEAERVEEDVLSKVQSTAPINVTSLDGRSAFCVQRGAGKAGYYKINGLPKSIEGLILQKLFLAKMVLQTDLDPVRVSNPRVRHCVKFLFDNAGNPEALRPIAVKLKELLDLEKHSVLNELKENLKNISSLLESYELFNDLQLLLNNPANAINMLKQKAPVVLSLFINEEKLTALLSKDRAIEELRALLDEEKEIIKFALRAYEDGLIDLTFNVLLYRDQKTDKSAMQVSIYDKVFGVRYILRELRKEGYDVKDEEVMMIVDRAEEFGNDRHLLENFSGALKVAVGPAAEMVPPDLIKFAGGDGVNTAQRVLSAVLDWLNTSNSDELHEDKIAAHGISERDIETILHNRTYVDCQI